VIRIEHLTEYTTAAHFVADQMRKEDRDELWILGRTLPSDAIETSIRVSNEAYIVYVSEKPAAVFGASIPVLGDVGVPWFLGTRAVDDHATEYMRKGREFTAHLLTQCERLENIALKSNRRTLVFLSRMGFVIGQAFRTATGAEAVRFTMERQAHV